MNHREVQVAHENGALHLKEMFPEFLQNYEILCNGVLVSSTDKIVQSHAIWILHGSRRISCQLR